MKNILSNLTGIFAILHAPLPAVPNSQEHPEPQQGTPHPMVPAWERLSLLLDAQVQAQTMDVREVRCVSTSINPEDLDMVLRELRCVQESVLSGLEIENALEDARLLEKRTK